MGIIGKEFSIHYDQYFPSLEIDINIFSPVLINNPTFRKLKNVLIDRGSDFTLIPNQIIKELGLKPTGSYTYVESFSGDVKKINFYVGKIVIEDVLEEVIPIGGIDATPIIGMDLISKCDLLINFSNNIFELASKKN